MNTEKKGSIRHFVTVLSCFLTFSAAVGIGFNCWSVLTIPICEELNITREQFGYIFLALQLALTVGGIIAADVIKKLGLMRYMQVGILALTLMMFMMSRVQSALGIYVTGFLVGLPMSCNFYLSYSVIVSNWFNELRGMMTGVIFMGSGLCSMIATPIVQHFSDTAGWRNTIVGMAVVTGIIALPNVFFLIKETPGELGLAPYGMPDKADDGVSGTREDGGPQKGNGAKKKAAKKTTGSGEEGGPEYSQIKKDPKFWIYGICLFGLQLQVLHIGTVVPYLTDLGYGAIYASRVYALCMGALALCRVSVGYISDRLGTKKTVTGLGILAFLYMGGLVMANFVPSMILISSAGIIMGSALMQGITTVTHPVVTLEMFGRREYTRTLGFYSAVMGAAGALPSFMYGRVYALTGSYLGSYEICFGIMIVSFVLLMATLYKKKS